jgi:hypothetical protein
MIKTSKDAKHSFENGTFCIEARWISITNPEYEKEMKQYYNQLRYERRKKRARKKTR